MRTLENNRDIHNYLKNEKEDNILKPNKVESINNNLINENSSIIAESFYIYDSTNSFLTKENESHIIHKDEESFNINENNEFKILKFMKIIGNHKISAEFIKEIQNGYLISGGGDNKLIIYSPNFAKIKEKKFRDIIYNIYEKKKSKNDLDLEILVCSKKKTIFIKIDENFVFDFYREIQGSTICMEFDYNDYIMCDKKGFSIFYNLFSKINETRKNHFLFWDISFKGGMIINNKIVALTSNKIVPNGKDKLIFFNIMFKKILYEIDGFSFIPSSNGLAVINRNENKILLCACKKYLRYQKNGILLINISLEENNNIKKIFYNTRNFEVYCFCQINILDKSNNYIFEENIITHDTAYFLVGGFEKNKNRGMIKLFKILDNENFLETKIEYIQDIGIEKTSEFKGFKWPINHIIQKKKKLNLLISSMDGNIYVFKPPNLDYFLFYDSQHK